MFYLSGTLDVEKVFSGEAARKFGLSPEQFLRRRPRFIDSTQVAQSCDKMSVRPILAVGDAYRLVGPFRGRLMLFH